MSTSADHNGSKLVLVITNTNCALSTTPISVAVPEKFPAWG